MCRSKYAGCSGRPPVPPDIQGALFTGAATAGERGALLRARALAGEKKAVLARRFGISREILYQYLRVG
jgi:hypothetical protein